MVGTLIKQRPLCVEQVHIEEGLSGTEPSESPVLQNIALVLLMYPFSRQGNVG